MPLKPSREIFITAAVTGAGATTDRSNKVPVTPRQIADAAIESAAAGAAIAHIHVRDPETGEPSRELGLFREVVDHIRASGIDIVLNLTAGVGGDLVLGSAEAPLPPDAAKTDMAGATERLAHVAELLPEICTLDCGTMNFGEGDYVMTNTPAMLKEMAAQIKRLGVRPEIEIFDTGHLPLAQWLQQQGLLDDPVLVQLCMGIPWARPMILRRWFPSSTICRKTGFSRPSPSAATSCPMRRSQCLQAAISAWGLKTISGSTRAFWHRMAIWSNGPGPSPSTWAPRF